MIRKYKQDVLVGRRGRRAILETLVKDDRVTFSVVLNGKVLASRSTSRTQDERIAIMRLSRAVSGLAYVFIVKVPQEKISILEKYERGRS